MFGHLTRPMARCCVSARKTPLVVLRIEINSRKRRLLTSRWKILRPMFGAQELSDTEYDEIGEYV